MKNKYKNIPIEELRIYLLEARLFGEQEEINEVATEIARRLYIPNDAVSFDEFKLQFGYMVEKKKNRGK